VFEKPNNKSTEKVFLETEPYYMFLFAIRSAKTKEKLVGRLEMFLNFIGLTKDNGDSIEVRCKSLIQKINENKNKDEIKIIAKRSLQKILIL
jgi:hypothetical protein